MPARQLIILLVLFASCLAVVGLAWATRSEIYLYTLDLPARWHSHLRFQIPPTHPGVIFGFLVLSLPLTYWLRQNGVYFFILLTAGIVLGSVVGFFVYGWVPSPTQHLLSVAMIATSIYGWKKKDYFEE
jgi:uncharacterized membrane protein YfcA